MTTMRMRVIRVDTLIAWSAIAHFVAEGMRFAGIFWKAIFIVSQIVGLTILSYLKKSPYTDGRVFTANEPSPLSTIGAAFVHLKQEET